jgi:hypothetical protein
MALPDPAAVEGLPDDAVVAYPAGGQTVFRILKANQPAKDDFRSDEMAGRPKGADETWIEHTGISVYDDVHVALALIGRFPVSIAEIDLPPDAGCSIAKTGPPHHFTVWGDRKTLLDSVRTVYLQKYASGPLEPRT